MKRVKGREQYSLANVSVEYCDKDEDPYENDILFNGKRLEWTKSKGNCRLVFFLTGKWSGFVLKVDRFKKEEQGLKSDEQTAAELDFYFKTCAARDRKYFVRPLVWGKTPCGRAWALYPRVEQTPTKTTAEQRAIVKRLTKKYDFCDIYPAATTSTTGNWVITPTGQVLVLDYGVPDTGW